MTDTCERFDTTTNNCEKLASMNKVASSICCCGFNGQYIFKFGGIGENRQLSNVIEKYDI